MTAARSTYISAAGYEIHVAEWGDRDRPALVMWHGLARNGRDFDEVATALADSYFVLCPDTIGRGLSSWAKAEDEYVFPVYAATALGILDHYGIHRLRWIGTSMGGLIGATLAADALKERITHLVLNDIGPDTPSTAADRIADYVGHPPIVKTMAALEAWYRTNYAPFGSNTDAFWRRLTENSMRRTDDGMITVHYDPGIAGPFRAGLRDLDVWPAYDRVTAKTLLLRGAQSDVLPRQVAEQMLVRGPKPIFIEFEGVGHAPTLTTPSEIAVLRGFLES